MNGVGILNYVKPLDMVTSIKTWDQKLYFGKYSAVKARKFMNMLKLGKNPRPSNYRKI